MVVDFDGRVLAQASPGPGERIVVAPVDVTALRHERATRRGHHMLAHLRTEAYPLYRGPRVPARGCPRPALLRGEQRAHRRGEEEPRVIASARVRPRMRPRPRRLVALALTAALALPPAGFAQEPAAPPAPERRRELGGLGEAHERLARAGVPLRRRAGRHVGAARAERGGGAAPGGRWPSTCRPSPPPAARPCASATRSPRRRRAPAPCPSPTRAATSGRSRCGASNAVLQGLLAWRPGGREEPLAEGFTSPDGQRPTTRLNGEVRLQRGGEEAQPAAPAAAAPAVAAEGAAAPAPHAGVGRHVGQPGSRHRRQRRRARPALRGEQARPGQLGVRGGDVLAARVHRGGHRQRPVLLRGQRRVRGVVRHDGRGRPAAARRATADRCPAEAALSCNSGICEDRFGRCPY